MQAKPKTPKKNIQPAPDMAKAGSNAAGVIYIDQDSDITSIVSKIRQESAKNIKLVVPKNSTALKSGVNLKLIQRTAHSKIKDLALITSDAKLISMAAAAKVATAPNLSAEPALARSAASNIRINDRQELDDTTTQEDLDEDLTIDDSELASTSSELSESDELPKKTKKDKKAGDKGKKIPNFYDFRKKALIGLGVLLGVVFILLLMMTSRKSAVIEIKANAERLDLNFTAKLNEKATETTKEEVKAIRKAGSKSVRDTVPATGQQDIGAKATGSMTLSIPCSSVSGSFPTISKGTIVTAAGLNFLTQTTVVLDKLAGGGSCKLAGDTTVTAEKAGDQYNLSPQNYKVSGLASVTGSGSKMAGGTTQIVKVVSDADVAALKEKLSKTNEDAYRTELKDQFSDSQKVLDDTFSVSLGSIQLTPTAGQQAETLSGTVAVDYAMFGVEEVELNKILDIRVTEVRKDDSQSIIKNGLDDLKLTLDSDGQFQFATVAYLGPNLDQEKIKRETAGKKKGEAIQFIKVQEGVNDATVKISPFWSSSLPGEGKIEIKIEVAESSSS
ncbi:MAG: hypothetical protein QG623_10 [Patescibacteria group bacterium]|nr:hypothetical protein [Patescibacteria group bacterium]